MLQQCDSPSRSSVSAGPTFRSLRLRLVLTLAPLSLLLVAAVAITVGRVSRLIASRVVVDSNVAFLEVLRSRLVDGGLERGEVERVLASLLTEPVRGGFVVGRGGEPWVVVGSVADPLALLADGSRRATGERPVAAVTGFGPIHARLVGAVQLDPNHLLVLERRIHGLWTPFTRAVVAIALGVVVVGVGSAYFLAGGLHRPLIRRLDALRGALVRYGTGDTTVRLQPAGERRDEFDQVFEAFNAMADRIVELEQGRLVQVEAERALLADLAHDINTPITVLRGYAETLVERGPDLDREAQRSIHTELLGQSLYVQAIVEDLLTLASARVAMLSVRPEAVDVDQLFDTVVDAFQPLAASRGATLLGDAGGVQVWADPVRFRQILTNLVRNALLHGSGATVIELGAQRQDGGSLLWVQDDGPGVAEEVVPQLFERRPPGERRSGPGWGLGLAIVRTLAELHGGVARYRALERGARFEVWLPGRGNGAGGEGTEADHAQSAAG